MSTYASSRRREGERIVHYEAASMAPVDAVLAEAHRLRRRETDRLLRAVAHRSQRATVSLLAPIFGWNRRHTRVPVGHDPQASLTSYVRTLRPHGSAANRGSWLGHRA